MFCHICGTQIADGAVFCHGCGTKVVYEKSDQPQDTPVYIVMPQQSDAAESALQIPAAPAQTPSSTGSECDFKEFVDNHVRATTKYQSAEELLNSRVSQKFMWICFGIPVVIGLIAREPLAALGIGLFFGYPAALLTDFIKGFSAKVKGPIEKINGGINSDELIQFLNGHLSYLSPHFHEWDYIKKIKYRGYGIKGAVIAHEWNSIEDSISAVRIGTGFGRKQRCFVVIWIEPDKTNPESGQTKYYFGSARNIWPSRYISMVKAVPVLQAAMEYYLTCYKNN